MKNLLYIGNKLSAHGLNQTSIETLGIFFKQEGYNVSFSSTKKNQLLRLLDMCLTVIAKWRKTDYVIIDTYSTSGFWFAFAVSQLCRILKLRYIPVLRGGNLPSRLKSNPALCRMIFKNAYKNIAPSNYLFSAFQNFGLTNLLFIPNNIEIKKYPFKLRNPLQPNLLWVRAFASIYNPKMAVDVFAEVKRKYPQATLCMVGPEKDGSMELCKKYAAEKGCDITFTGKLAKEDWIALSAGYDVFINTTHFDNTPVSVMEAMALGLPVVTTNVGGIPFLLDHGKDAILVNDNDIFAMANAICDLAEDPQMAQNIVHKARIKAENWDWEIIKLQWKQLLE
nr:glycosyltransferase family 4 protein [uncultured Flavobacterium sp.]